LARDPEVVRLRDADELAAAAAERMAAGLAAAPGSPERPFALFLSGGSTPGRLFRLLASPAYSGLPYHRVAVFWGDERCVPPEDPRSNYRLALESGLLARPFAAIHRMPGERPAPEGAAAYEQTLRAWAGPEALPPLDLVLLGLGADGHTASLFPGSAALAEEGRWVVATEPHDGLRRLTLTMPVLLAARRLFLVVGGVHKADALRRVLIERDPQAPAGRLLAAGERLTIMVDEGAASRLPEPA